MWYYVALQTSTFSSNEVMGKLLGGTGGQAENLILLKSPARSIATGLHTKEKRKKKKEKAEEGKNKIL